MTVTWCPMGKSQIVIRTKFDSKEIWYLFYYNGFTLLLKTFIMCNIFFSIWCLWLTMKMKLFLYISYFLRFWLIYVIYWDFCFKKFFGKIHSWCPPLLLLIFFLASLFTHTYNSSHMPEAWNHSITVSLCKKDNHTNPSNYCLISKLYELFLCH